MISNRSQFWPSNFRRKGVVSGVITLNFRCCNPKLGTIIPNLLSPQKPEFETARTLAEPLLPEVRFYPQARLAKRTLILATLPFPAQTESSLHQSLIRILRQNAC